MVVPRRQDFFSPLLLFPISVGSVGSYGFFFFSSFIFLLKPLQTLGKSRKSQSVTFADKRVGSCRRCRH
jgi:hypothetical protein